MTIIRPTRAGPTHWMVLWLSFLFAPLAQAKIQFDVFAGYGDAGGGHVRAGGWYPVAIEVLNDGPTFDAVIEISAGQFGSQVQRIPVELPTNTRKRIVVPFFCTSAGILVLDGRLFDRGGKLRDERTGLRLDVVQWETTLLGALPGTFAGMPSFPADKQGRPEWQPVAARMESDYLPDNPIALEGLNAFYLNSAKALALKEPQVDALVSWLHGGGHLIVAIDQTADVEAAPWLKDLLPARVAGGSNRAIGGQLHAWVTSGDFPVQNGYAPPLLKGRAQVRGPRKNAQNVVDPGSPYAQLAVDAAFNTADQALLDLTPKDGQVALQAGAMPLVVTGSRGRGQVTLLAFNPEREPLKSWKLRPWLWARICDVPGTFLRGSDFSTYGGRSMDGVFGSMIETRQVRKLPVGFLLLLLVVYLAVIGPIDQWWLKKIDRPMLTWITFPAYVALFSLLIYFIGFKLRAGQSEWNELHIVDVLPQGDGTRAALRGRTFASIYSPRNDTYKIGTDVAHATFRAEFQGLWGNGTGEGKVAVTAKPAGFDAEVFVPVWTSQLNVADWQDSGDAPLTAVRGGNTRYTTVTVANRTASKVSQVWVVPSGGPVQKFGGIDPGASVDLEMDGKGATSLEPYVAEHNAEFQNAVARRGEMFGGNEKTHIDDWAGSAVAASFPSLLALDNGDARDFVWPAGLDLAPLARRGDTIVLAWMPDASVVPPLSRFAPKRSQKGTLLRLVIPAPR